MDRPREKFCFRQRRSVTSATYRLRGNSINFLLLEGGEGCVSNFPL